jgi:hypothetical protein
MPSLIAIFSGTTIYIHPAYGYALREYTVNPILEIDNNISERTLRMVVIGRKNYLCAGNGSLAGIDHLQPCVKLQTQRHRSLRILQRCPEKNKHPPGKTSRPTKITPAPAISPANQTSKEMYLLGTLQNK